MVSHFYEIHFYWYTHAHNGFLLTTALTWAVVGHCWGHWPSFHQTGALDISSSTVKRININQLVGEEDGTVLVQSYWQEHVSPYFRPLPQIKQYQHFLCVHTESAQRGKWSRKSFIVYWEPGGQRGKRGIGGGGWTRRLRRIKKSKKSSNFM